MPTANNDIPISRGVTGSSLGYGGQSASTPLYQTTTTQKPMVRSRYEPNSNALNTSSARSNNQIG